MVDAKSLMSHIRKAAVANAIMFVYFFSPSFLSFIAILLAGLAVIFHDPTQSLKSFINCSQDCNTSKWINQTYQNLKRLTLLQKLLLLVFIKLSINFIWLLPSWLFVFIGVQVFSYWGLLQQLGIINLGKKYVELGHLSIQKLARMIPKYQAK